MSSQNQPIFIVGSSRSGSTLLAAMLSAHSAIACGPETQILNKIDSASLNELLTAEDWPSEAYRHLCGVTLAEQRVIDAYELSKDEVLDYLSLKEPSIAALFEVVCETFARKKNKRRWAEKTPRHLLHLDTIRKEFPEAKIIRIVRDPRDSAISMRKLAWASNEFLPNLYLWCEWFRKTDRFFDQDDCSLTIKYESLVEHPAQAMMKVCEFIEEDYEESMLDTSGSGSFVSTKNEVWKQQVTGPLDVSRLYRWKKDLSEEEIRVADYISHLWLSKFEYEIRYKPEITMPAFGLTRDAIEDNYDFIVSESMAKRAIVPSVDPDNEEKLIIFVNKKLSRSGKAFLRMILMLSSRFFARKKNYVLDASGKLSHIRTVVIGVFSSRY